MGAALTEDVTGRDVGPVGGIVSEDANTDLVFAGGRLDAELEVRGGELAVGLKDVGEQVRERATANLGRLEVAVEDVVARIGAAEQELFAGGASLIVNRHLAAPTVLQWRGA